MGEGMWSRWRLASFRACVASVLAFAQEGTAAQSGAVRSRDDLSLGEGTERRGGKKRASLRFCAAAPWHMDNLMKACTEGCGVAVKEHTH